MNDLLFCCVLKKEIWKRGKHMIIWPRYITRCRNIFSIRVTWKLGRPVSSSSKCFLGKEEKTIWPGLVSGPLQERHLADSWTTSRTWRNWWERSGSDVFRWLFTSAVNVFINKNCKYIHTDYKYFPFFIFENQKALIGGVLGKN